MAEPAEDCLLALAFRADWREKFLNPQEILLSEMPGATLADATPGLGFFVR